MKIKKWSYSLLGIFNFVYFLQINQSTFYFNVLIVDIYPNAKVQLNQRG